MDVWISVLVFCSVLLAVLYIDAQKTKQAKLWKSSVRGRFSAINVSMFDKWKIELHRMHTSLPKIISLGFGSLFILFILFSIISGSFLEGGGLSLLATVFLIRGWIKYQERRVRRKLLTGFLSEAVLIGAPALKATGRLELAFHDIAQMARNSHVKEAFGSLDAAWKLQKLSPEEAFIRQAQSWGVPEVLRLAIITKEAVAFNADLADLWLEYAAQVEEDQQYVRMLRAKTSAGRRNAMLFLIIVLSLFILGYPRGSRYLTSFSFTMYWITLGFILLGGWIIWRRGKRITV